MTYETAAHEVPNRSGEIADSLGREVREARSSQRQAIEANERAATTGGCERS